MENPRTWGKIKRTIQKAVAKHEKAMKVNMVGSSLVSKIYNELKTAGFVGEDVPVEDEYKDDVFNKEPEDWKI